VTVPDPTMRPAENWAHLTPTAASSAPVPASTLVPRQPEAPSTPKPQLVARTVADIESEEVEWLWRGRIPLGMLTILDGDPGLGKSLITASLAAAVSTGDALPGGDKAPPAGVLFLAAEDDPARVIRPRLEAAGANLRRVRVIDEIKNGDWTRPVSFPEDLPLLEEMIRERGVRLVIVDPIMAYLNGAIDAHRDQAVRPVLSAMKAIAERTGAAFVLVRHLNKMAGSAAIYRGGGSIAFTAAARSALTVGRHPDGGETCVLAVAKCNLAARPSALAYSVESWNGVPVIVWGEECELTADELVAEPTRPKRDGKQSQCEQWLRETLKDGPLPSATLEERAKEAGFSPATLKRARQEVGVRTEEEEGKGGKWLVGLPEPESNGHEKDSPER
jgi:hypothetical protein